MTGKEKGLYFFLQTGMPNVSRPGCRYKGKPVPRRVKEDDDVVVAVVVVGVVVVVEEDGDDVVVVDNVKVLVDVDVLGT